MNLLRPLTRSLIVVVSLALPALTVSPASLDGRSTTGTEIERMNNGSHRYLVKVFSLQNPDDPKSTSTGSGELIKNPDGVMRILTNHHVIGPHSNEVWVQFDRGGVAQKVRVLGRDRMVDLALLEAPSPLPVLAEAIPITRSPVAIGDRVYAAGYPSGNRTISSGIVVSLSSPAEDDGIGIYFSHQAPIAPGSSGGILVRFNMAGKEELVGVNTRVGIVDGGKLISNFGLSIRPEVVARMISKLETEQQVTHVFAGFIAQDTLRTNPYVYELFVEQPYPPRRSGVLVTRVAPQSPVGRAGIQLGDMLRKLELFSGGRWVAIPFNSASELQEIVFFDVKPGTRARLTTERGTQIVAREFVFEAYPQAQ